MSQTTSQKNWYEKNKHIRKEKLVNMKKLIFQHYGHKCVCCGTTEYKFLTIDHKNNDGYLVERCGKSRLAGTTIYPKIIRNNFPSHYQLLCWNCNCGKAYNKGVCPHKEGLL